MKKTGIFLVALVAFVVVAALAWEGYALMDPDDDVALITTVVRAASQAWGCILAFVSGLVVGLLGAHFWWCGRG